MSEKKKVYDPAMPTEVFYVTADLKVESYTIEVAAEDGQSFYTRRRSGRRRTFYSPYYKAHYFLTAAEAHVAAVSRGKLMVSGAESQLAFAHRALHSAETAFAEHVQKLQEGK